MSKRKYKLKTWPKVLLVILIIVVVGSIAGYKKYQEYKNTQTYEYKLLQKYNEADTKIFLEHLTNEELALLQKMKLKITKQDNEVILDSNLANKDKHSLGIYSYGKGDIFKIEVSLPNDIDNNYSKLFAKVIWRFSFDDLEKNEDINPHTGDMIFDLSINLFIASSMGFIIVLFLWKKESDKEDK